jgi:hypothetical protein
MRWRRGDVIVYRDVWRGRPWSAVTNVVIDDTPDLFVSYIPEEAPLAFPPSADGRSHPWASRRAWEGHGVLILRRPGEAYSVMHFWDGPDRRFAGWYVNLEEPFRRTSIGLDSKDLTLDVWIPVDGEWRFKDEEQLEERVEDGFFTVAQANAIRRLGAEIAAMLDRGERWWDDGWRAFEPDPAWRAPAFPRGWEAAEVPAAPGVDAYRTLAQ